MRSRQLAVLAGASLVLTYASHVGAMVLVTWRAMARHRGRGHGGQRIRDHLPAYAYPRRRIGPRLEVPVIIPGDTAVPPGKIVWN